jgi:hypothetical protein
MNGVLRTVAERSAGPAWLLPAQQYGGVAKRGYEAIAANAKIDDNGLVDLHNACDGLCVQASYADYINYKKTVNAKVGGGGFPVGHESSRSWSVMFPKTRVTPRCSA